MANPVVVTDALFTPAPPSGSPVLSASKARTGLAALVAHDGAGTRLGIFYEGNQALVAGTATTSPSMQVSVSPLAWCGQKASSEGVYVGRSTATVLVDVAAAPASNSRIDVVYVMERDASATTSPDGVTQGEIGVITGTAAASPTKPAIPVGAVEIGTLTVNAGVTATTNAGCTVATTCQWTSAAGSPIPVTNQAQRDALTKFDGLRVSRLDKGGAIEPSDGTNWSLPFADFYRGTNSPFAAGNTILAFPNQNYLEGGMSYSAGTFTVPIAGRYRATCLVSFTVASGLTAIGAAILVNTSNTVALSTVPVGSSGTFSADAARTVRLNAGDGIQFQAYHNASAAIATQTDPWRTWAQVEWVGP